MAAAAAGPTQVQRRPQGRARASPGAGSAAPTAGRRRRRRRRPLHPPRPSSRILTGLGSRVQQRKQPPPRCCAVGQCRGPGAAKGRGKRASRETERARSGGANKMAATPLYRLSLSPLPPTRPSPSLRASTPNTSQLCAAAEPPEVSRELRRADCPAKRNGEIGEVSDPAPFPGLGTRFLVTSEDARPLKISALECVLLDFRKWFSVFRL